MLKAGPLEQQFGHIVVPNLPAKMGNGVSNRIAFQRVVTIAPRSKLGSVGTIITFFFPNTNKAIT